MCEACEDKPAVVMLVNSDEVYHLCNPCGLAMIAEIATENRRRRAILN